VGQEYRDEQDDGIEREPAGDRELLVITGMSGAGRSTTADVLEDLGWYVVDNLPPQMIGSLLELTATVGADAHRLAVVVNARVRSFFTVLRTALAQVRQAGTPTRVLFLDAGDEALVRRFESVRRPHPLQGHGRLLDGIARERELLGELRLLADTTIDTSRLNVHQLAARVRETIGGEELPELRITVMSFGFKYGLPLDADHVADMRFLPNPYWKPELRHHTGLDRQVSDYVLHTEGVKRFLDSYTSALRPVFAGYLRENKHYATIAIGCTGGKHRSVALTEEIAARLREDGVTTTIVHRDLGRE
jgi:RNase adapter protein RapZ